MRPMIPGETIFREGDIGDCAYLIESGEVQIFIEKGETEVPLRVLGPGEVFGEMALIDDTPRSASCRALSVGQLIVVTKEQLVDRVHKADPVVRLLVQVLLERLRSHNNHLKGKPNFGPDVPHISHAAVENKEALERIGLEDRISTALDNDEFIPYYQPIYDLTSGTIIGCEALMRWISKTDGVISPYVFMDVMEESWLILRAGRRMLEKALADLPVFAENFGENFFVGVNVSGRQFVEPGFVDHIENCRKLSNVKAPQIKLELTERIMTEGETAVQTMQECRNFGYKLAIDDFGTGFSSLQYLAQMPLTDLKIDRSFVLKMIEDDKSLSVIRSLIHMAELLGLKLIAEGVETKEQLAMLKGLGVSMGQGFLFSKPLPYEDFLMLAQPNKKRKSA